MVEPFVLAQPVSRQRPADRVRTSLSTSIETIGTSARTFGIP
ncbi:hypothetical protein DVS28_a0084 [Euzebya pacifica]|uniref:Uncharacterized protein n=1 Tax=Euzebya pacifica TaxID=1608957 RepID=A0A346XRE5_9ACTN|nr:hypothetical protein DVS28_a0084 [Euzebya pacifica]